MTKKKKKKVNSSGRHSNPQIKMVSLEKCMQLNPTAIINKTKQTRQRGRRYSNKPRLRPGRKAGATVDTRYLAFATLNHFTSQQDWHQWQEVCAYLEEAMSSVSLSKPERSILRYVHVRGLHHPLIDPAKTNSAMVMLVTDWWSFHWFRKKKKKQHLPLHWRSCPVKSFCYLLPWGGYR